MSEDWRQQQLILMTTSKDAFKMKKVLEIHSHCADVKFKWNLHRQCLLQSACDGIIEIYGYWQVEP